MNRAACWRASSIQPSSRFPRFSETCSCGADFCLSRVSVHSRASVESAASISQLHSPSPARSQLICELRWNCPLAFRKNCRSKASTSVCFARESHVEQPLHFLSLDLLKLVFAFIEICSIKNDLCLACVHASNHVRISWWRGANFARQERHDHGLPLGALGFVGGDQLDRFTRRRMALPCRVKVRSQALREICKRKSARFGGRGNAAQGVEFAA